VASLGIAVARVEIRAEHLILLGARISPTRSRYITPQLCDLPLILPEVSEAGWRKLGVADRVLDVLVPEVVL